MSSEAWKTENKLFVERPRKPINSTIMSAAPKQFFLDRTLANGKLRAVPRARQLAGCLGLLASLTIPGASPTHAATIRDDQPDTSYTSLANRPEYASVGVFVNNWGYTSTVPEPSTNALLTCGLVLLGWRCVRRRSGALTRIFAASALLIFPLASTRGAELSKLKILYVGTPGSDRARQVTAFLQENVARVETAPRRGFKPQLASGFDVVVLDWPQEGRQELDWKEPPPLGDRQAWTKPTVLLGSAGLNLAVVWKVRGGAG